MLLRVIARLLRLARHSLTLDMIKLKLPRPKAQCKPPFFTDVYVDLWDNANGYALV